VISKTVIQFKELFPAHWELITAAWGFSLRKPAFLTSIFMSDMEQEDPPHPNPLPLLGERE
jgi:hypothetical protein